MVDFITSINIESFLIPYKISDLHIVAFYGKIVSDFHCKNNCVRTCGANMQDENELWLSYYREITDIDEKHAAKLIQYIENGRIFEMKNCATYGIIKTCACCHFVQQK